MSSYVYKFVDRNGSIIYIGKTTNLNDRLKHQHFTKNGHLPKECYDETVKIYYAKLMNNDEMSIYERYLINFHTPKYNISHNNNSMFQFVLPELEWLDFDEVTRSSFSKPLETDKRSYYDLEKRKYVKELLKNKESIIQNNSKLKLINLLKEVSILEKLEFNQLVEIIKTYILSKHRKYYVNSIDCYFFEINNLLESHNLLHINKYDFWNLHSLEKDFENMGLKLFKSGFSLKTASPHEFYYHLIKLSKMLFLNNIHKDWMREYSSLCEMNFTIRNKEQDKLLMENNIEISPNWFTIKEFNTSNYAV